MSFHKSVLGRGMDRIMQDVKTVGEYAAQVAARDKAEDQRKKERTELSWRLNDVVSRSELDQVLSILNEYNISKRA